MNRLLAATAVLLLHETARADMGMPGDRHIPVRVTLTVDPPPPGVVLFIRDLGPIHRMPATSPIIIESPPGGGGAGFTIYAVPQSVVESWPAGMPPHHDWFGYPERPKCKLVAVGGAKGRVSFNDDRKVIEQEYRLVRGGDAMRLEKVFENEGSRWYRTVVGYGICCGLPIGIAGLGFWLVRRLFRRLLQSS